MEWYYFLGNVETSFYVGLPNRVIGEDLGLMVEEIIDEKDDWACSESLVSDDASVKGSMAKHLDTLVLEIKEQPVGYALAGIRADAIMRSGCIVYDPKFYKKTMLYSGLAILPFRWDGEPVDPVTDGGHEIVLKLIEDPLEEKIESKPKLTRTTEYNIPTTYLAPVKTKSDSKITDFLTGSDVEEALRSYLEDDEDITYEGGNVLKVGDTEYFISGFLKVKPGEKPMYTQDWTGEDVKLRYGSVLSQDSGGNLSSISRNDPKKGFIVRRVEEAIATYKNLLESIQVASSQTNQP